MPPTAPASTPKPLVPASVAGMTSLNVLTGGIDRAFTRTPNGPLKDARTAASQMTSNNPDAIPTIHGDVSTVTTPRLTLRPIPGMDVETAGRDEVSASRSPRLRSGAGDLLPG